MIKSYHSSEIAIASIELSLFFFICLKELNIKFRDFRFFNKWGAVSSINSNVYSHFKNWKVAHSAIALMGSKLKADFIRNLLWEHSDRTFSQLLFLTKAINFSSKKSSPIKGILVRLSKVSRGRSSSGLRSEPRLREDLMCSK